MNSQEKYNTYLSRIKSYGCKIVASKISDGIVAKVYRGATTTIIVQIGTQKDDYSATKTLYTFSVLENSDYDLNFSEDY